MYNEKPISNDMITLIPKTPVADRSLEFDFPSVQIGAAEYSEGPTGCTVFYFPEGATCAVDVRGGSPGTLMTQDGCVHAVCFAGGSLYGLEAAAGVAAELFQLHDYSPHWADIAVVSGAVIYDYSPRRNSIYPDKLLGRVALKSARPGGFALGPHGAGVSATVGKMFGGKFRETAGQGGAFRQIGPNKIAVFSVVNAMGAIVNRHGHVVRGHLDRQTGNRMSAIEILECKDRINEFPNPVSKNSTLTIIIINQKLEIPELQLISKQAHSSLSRVIQPFHGIDDGDVLYVVTTNEIAREAMPFSSLSIFASELACDAILTSF